MDEKIKIESKYWDIYTKSKSRDDFIYKAMKAFPGLIRATAVRSYNKLKIKVNIELNNGLLGLIRPKKIEPPIRNIIKPIKTYKKSVNPEKTVEDALKPQKPVKTQENGQENEDIHTLQKFKSIILPDETSVLQDLLAMPITKIKNNGYIDVRHIVQILLKHTTLHEKVHQQESVYYNPVIRKSADYDNDNNDDDLLKPDALKLLTISDMVSRGFKPNREFLIRYGYSTGEILWLRKNGFIKLED